MTLEQRVEELEKNIKNINHPSNVKGWKIHYSGKLIIK